MRFARRRELGLLRAWKNSFCIVVLTVSITGCASMFNRSAHYSMMVSCNEPNVKVDVYNRGRLVGTYEDPSFINLESSAGYFKPSQYSFLFSKAGFETETKCVNAKTTGSYWLNILFLYGAPLTMLLIDPLTGAIYELPERTMYVDMKPLKPVRSALASGQEVVCAPLKMKTLPTPTENGGYRVVSYKRMSGKDVAFSFTVELGNNSALEDVDQVRDKVGSLVRKSYSGECVESALLWVEFPEFSVENNMVRGIAVLWEMKIESLSYDERTRKGKICVRYPPGKYEVARQWLRKNIETLAKDKNIALETGTLPPTAKFYLGNEEVKDGNIIEMEFETE